MSDKRNFRLGLPRVTLQTEQGRDYVARMIEKHDAEFIVLDALFTLTTPELEKDIGTWNMLKEWMKYQTLQGRHLLLLHHDNKGGGPFGTSTGEIEHGLMMQLKRKDNLSVGGRWAFELSFFKPRHLSPEESRPKIITTNVEGTVDWQVSEDEGTARHGKKLTPEERAEIVQMLREGKVPQTKIAEAYHVDKSRITQIKKEAGLA